MRDVAQKQSELQPASRDLIGPKQEDADDPDEVTKIVTSYFMQTSLMWLTIQQGEDFVCPCMS